MTLTLENMVLLRVKCKLLRAVSCMSGTPLGIPAEVKHARPTRSLRGTSRTTRASSHAFFTSVKLLKHRKIPIISPGVIILFAQKAFLVGLFSGELIFGMGLSAEGVLRSQMVGLDNKDSFKLQDDGQKQLDKTAHPTVHGLIFGRSYYRKDICICDLGGLFSGGLIFGRAYIGILR